MCCQDSTWYSPECGDRSRSHLAAHLGRPEGRVQPGSVRANHAVQPVCAKESLLAPDRGFLWLGTIQSILWSFAWFNFSNVGDYMLSKSTIARTSDKHGTIAKKFSRLK